MKKNKGFSVFEVVVAISLLGLTITPLLRFNSYLLTSYRKNIILEKKIKNIVAISAQLNATPIELLSKNIGTYLYNGEEFNNSLISSFLLPYPDTKIDTLSITISNSTLKTSVEYLPCIKIEVLYLFEKREIKIISYKFS